MSDAHEFITISASVRLRNELGEFEYETSISMGEPETSDVLSEAALMSRIDALGRVAWQRTLSAMEKAKEQFSE
jgi:hypothetical protein